MDMKSRTDETSRIERCFNSLRRRGEKALVIFITAGDPGLDVTGELILEFERRGADIIELGIPFSDPMADGTTIQASSERALKNGTTLSKILGFIKKLRRKTEIPILLFGYYNPVFVFGVENFSRRAKSAGVDGVLIVDLPPEESEDLKRWAGKYGLDLIHLLTPTSNDQRIRAVTESSSGFIYYVSVAGVTGARRRLSETISRSVGNIRRYTSLPVCVGFGISSPEQAQAVAAYSDGVVVGSAVIKVIRDNAGSSDMVTDAGMFVERLKNGMRSVKQSVIL